MEKKSDREQKITRGQKPKVMPRLAAVGEISEAFGEIGSGKESNTRRRVVATERNFIPELQLLASDKVGIAVCSEDIQSDIGGAQEIRDGYFIEVEHEQQESGIVAHVGHEAWRADDERVTESGMGYAIGIVRPRGAGVVLDLYREGRRSEAGS